MLTEKAAWKALKPDYLSAWTLITAFFIFSFNFVLLETLGTSLTMDQFAWTKQEALYYMGILMSVGGVIACAMFAILGKACKKFGELHVLMWGGFLLMVLGCLSFIPWGTDPPLISYSGLHAVNASNASDVGCPISQEWCLYTPAITLRQFLIGYTFIAFGYPVGITLIQTVFSKMLGPRPQGVWMGLMTGSGCLSRVMGPVCVSVVYTRLGTVWTFGMTTSMMVATMIWLQLLLNRLKASCEIAARLNSSKSKNDECNGKNDIELMDMPRS